MRGTKPCPLCGRPTDDWERYRDSICVRCETRAVDEQGRPMRFGNESLLGTGFVAEVEEGGEWRPVEAGFQAPCFVDGRRCVAAEHRFGGIVVQLAPGPG